MSLLVVNRQISSTISLNESQTKALYKLSMKCLEKSHAADSDFSVDRDEFILLGKMIKDIKESGIINEEYI